MDVVSVILNGLKYMWEIIRAVLRAFGINI